MQLCQMMKKTMKKALLQTLTPPPNNIMEIEGVDRMGNETKERYDGDGTPIEAALSENKLLED